MVHTKVLNSVHVLHSKHYDSYGMYYVCKNPVLCDEEGDKKEESSTIVRKLAQLRCC